MSASEKEPEKGKKDNRENAVIEIRISIPPDFGNGLTGFMTHMSKAAREVAKAGMSFIKEEEKSPKMRKIEIK